MQAARKRPTEANWGKVLQGRKRNVAEIKSARMAVLWVGEHIVGKGKR